MGILKITEDVPVATTNAIASDWCLDFEASPHFEGLDERQQLLSEDIITFFCEFMASGAGIKPQLWQPELVEEVLVYGFPAHIAADESYFLAVKPVLSHFISFLSSIKLIEATQRLKLQNQIESSDTLMLRNAFDRSCWGLAKSMVMQAWEAGIDPTDDEALSHYLQHHLDPDDSSSAVS